MWGASCLLGSVTLSRVTRGGRTSRAGLGIDFRIWGLDPSDTAPHAPGHKGVSSATPNYLTRSQTLSVRWERVPPRAFPRESSL